MLLEASALTNRQTGLNTHKNKPHVYLYYTYWSGQKKIYYYYKDIFKKDVKIIMHKYPMFTLSGSFNMPSMAGSGLISSAKWFISFWASTARALGVFTLSSWSPKCTTFVATKSIRSSSSWKVSQAA